MIEFYRKLIQEFQAEIAEKNRNKIDFEQEDIFGVEDCLGHYEVFYSLIDDRPCHSDSYMSWVNYEKLNQAIEELDLPENLIKFCIDYWVNSQINLKIVAGVWAKKFDMQTI